MISDEKNSDSAATDDCMHIVIRGNTCRYDKSCPK